MIAIANQILNCPFYWRFRFSWTTRRYYRNVVFLLLSFRLHDSKRLPSKPVICDPFLNWLFPSNLTKRHSYWVDFFLCIERDTKVISISNLMVCFGFSAPNKQTLFQMTLSSVSIHKIESLILEEKKRKWNKFKMLIIRKCCDVRWCIANIILWRLEMRCSDYSNAYFKARIATLKMPHIQIIVIAFCGIAKCNANISLAYHSFFGHKIHSNLFILIFIVC